MSQMNSFINKKRKFSIFFIFKKKKIILYNDEIIIITLKNNLWYADITSRIIYQNYKLCNMKNKKYFSIPFDYKLNIN